jgi:hypothetical protein
MQGNWIDTTYTGTFTGQRKEGAITTTTPASAVVTAPKSLAEIVGTWKSSTGTSLLVDSTGKINAINLSLSAYFFEVPGTVKAAFTNITIDNSFKFTSNYSGHDESAKIDGTFLSPTTLQIKYTANMAFSSNGSNWGSGSGTITFTKQ